MSDVDRLVAVLRKSPRLMHVMQRARELDLPDWRLVSGCLYQTAWNDLTGREADYGLKDYDLAYFDADISYEAEDVHIRRAAAAFDPPWMRWWRCATRRACISGSSTGSVNPMRRWPVRTRR